MSDGLGWTGSIMWFSFENFGGFRQRVGVHERGELLAMPAWNQALPDSHLQPAAQKSLEGNIVARDRRMPFAKLLKLLPEHSSHLPFLAANLSSSTE